MELADDLREEALNLHSADTPNSDLANLLEQAADELDQAADRPSPLSFFETLDTRSDDDLLTARNRIDIELRRRQTILGERRLYSMGENGLPLALNFQELQVSTEGEIMQARVVRSAIAERDEFLAQRLREAGKGWAAGYRLLPTAPTYRARPGLVDKVELEWEITLLKLDQDGSLPAARADWTYVTLREQQP